jgi:glutamyl/glutaminyl-tRNA synthetase
MLPCVCLPVVVIRLYIRLDCSFIILVILYQPRSLFIRVATNLKMWQEMVKGSASGVKCVVRAKILYDSPNGALRDPAMYRCRPEPHVRYVHLRNGLSTVP